MKRAWNTHPAPDEEEKTDRYLLTYADLITLLLGLFIVLYGVSKIDASKYQQVAGVFEHLFGGKVAMVNSVLPNEATAPLQVQAQRAELIKKIQTAVGSNQFGNGVIVSKNERGITIHMLEKLLFTSGDATVKPSAYATLDSIATVISTLPNDVRVEGHTDNVPIATPEFPSNWHLSVSRAVNTAFYLITRHGLNPDKIAVVGYSEFKPLVDNSTEEHRARNRRVDIVILDRPDQQRTKE
ncbi:MAG TPA: OmpA family protein [Bacteroidota bacterium]|nr:OmpA family protein [Bacteroidota bacterium]